MHGLAAFATLRFFLQCVNTLLVEFASAVAGVCDHRPPRSEPAFRLAEPARAASEAAPPPGAAGARSPGAKPWSKHLAPGLHARASAFSGGESRRT